MPSPGLTASLPPENGVRHSEHGHWSVSFPSLPVSARSLVPAWSCSFVTFITTIYMLDCLAVLVVLLLLLLGRLAPAAAVPRCCRTGYGRFRYSATCCAVAG